MRRILFMLAMVFGLSLSLVSGASAVTTPHNCHSKSGLGYNVTICSQFEWRPQNDNNGVYLEGVYIWVENGCGDLESTPLSSLWVGIGDTDGTSTVGSSISSLNDCEAYRDLELRGQDTGPSRAVLTMDVNVNQASDHAASHYCKIRPTNILMTDCWTWHN